MGTYNHANVRLTCPRCKKTAETIVDLHFGVTGGMEKIEIGGLYTFFEKRQSHNGGPPPDGIVEAGGYTECPVCGKDYFCDVRLGPRENGKRDRKWLLLPMEEIYPSTTFPPYIPDREVNGEVSCPECGSKDTRQQFFDGMKIGRMICEAEDCYCVEINGLDED